MNNGYIYTELKNKITMAYFEGINNGCDRCSRETTRITGSYFNTEMICMDCSTKEKAHSAYENAKRVEAEEVRKGNYNFEGVGKPVDL